MSANDKLVTVSELYSLENCILYFVYNRPQTSGFADKVGALRDDLSGGAGLGQILQGE